MGTDRIWHGVRLRQVELGADPDAPPRSVRLPASWDDAAAEALCALAPDATRVSLPGLAQGWVRPLAARAREVGLDDLSDRLHALLLLRRGAPTEGIWRNVADAVPGFVLNLPAFHDPVAGFDAEAFADAVTTGAQAMQLVLPAAHQVAVAMADLAGLLALLGLDYASQPARDVAACLAGILRGRADAVMAGPQLDLLTTIPAWPAPPMHCVVPGLAYAAAAARAAAVRCAAARPSTAILPPSSVDALLGVETGGIAPSFAAVGPAGLTRSARAWLDARGITLETALAAALAQEAVFPAIRPADHVAMHDTVAAMLHTMPPRPVATPLPVASPQREELPSRRRGFTQKAAIGGHRVFLRTGEYADGRLGEIGLSLPRETATVRGLADGLAAAVSLGLQHGVTLESFVDLFTQPGPRFAPAGAVEGDPAVTLAASIPDYVFRSLADNYLGRAVTPDAEPAPIVPEPSPLLPLDWPREARRRTGLRLVSAG